MSLFSLFIVNILNYKGWSSKIYTKTTGLCATNCLKHSVLGIKPLQLELPERREYLSSDGVFTGQVLNYLSKIALART